MNEQDSLMKQIIEETYQDETDNVSPISLVNYFEKRLNEVEYTSLKKFLINENVQFYPLRFEPLTKCFRVEIGGAQIDFPSNWSIFKKLETEQLAYVKNYKDEDYLCEIFLSHVGEVKIIVLASENDETNLIFLNSNKSESQLEWFENFFKIRDTAEIKKAS